MTIELKSKIRPQMVYNLFLRNYCSNISSETNTKEQNITSNGIPEAPTTCCMTGCPNCVWLEYAEKLTDYFKDGGVKAWKEIDKQVNDPNVKAYLMHELRMRNSTK